MATHSWGQTGRRNIRRAYKKKICEICGDIGYQEAIITCHRCKDVDVHRYCVLGYFVAAAVYWCCEKCDKGKGVISSLRGPENEYSEGSKIHASTKISQSTLPPKKRMRYPSWHCINGEKRVKIRKMKYVSCSGPDGPTLKSSDAMTASGMMNPLMTQPCDPALDHSSSDAMTASGMMNPLMTHPCDPALDHSWKGSFDILGAPEIVPTMLNNCIQAHPPSKVRRIVYEYSRLLPATLKFQLVPRGNIWASLFNNHIPGKEDIGLYFFTSKKERSEIYITLVEFMRKQDLVMRMLINDVELLILASTALRSDSQRWNNKHFLWGLFYRMRQGTDGCAEGGSNIVTEMDVLEGEATK